MLKEYIHLNCYKWKEEPFILSSGRKSNLYFDLRKLTLNPRILNIAIFDIQTSLIPMDYSTKKFKAVAGLTMGADPITLKLAEFTYTDPLIIRKEPKKHGTQSQIEGLIPPKSSEIIVVDDVITTGGSIIKAIEILRNNGYNVNYAYSILDREEGGKEALESLGIGLRSLFKKSDFGQEHAQ